jgi:hypothetical protein
LTLLVLMGLAAFAVDVGHWYLVGQQEQNAADAAAMAGVTSLPGDTVGAFATAQNYSKINGFQNLVNATTVTPVLDSSTRLRVTVNRSVTNFFGSLMGVPTTNVSRTAVADYSGPVPLGSPCNEFGDDPDAATNNDRSANCTAAGSFWANVGSLAATKVSGDAYQDGNCSGLAPAFPDGCSSTAVSGANTDYDPNGYFYSVTIRQPIANLQIDAFDPALIDVGDTCTSSNLVKAKNLPAADTLVTDPLTRYANGTTAYCTGDVRYGGTGDVATQFTVRSPGPNPWDPMSFPPVGGSCTQTFAGYHGDLNVALDKTAGGYQPLVAKYFRQWVPLCTIANAQPGTYMIQVKTNDVGNNAGNGHNRFSLRAYGSSSAENDAISVAGFTKMTLYANTPNGFTVRDYLARIPSGAKGELFNVRLYDIGDGAEGGGYSTIQILPPSEVGATFSGCTGTGPQTAALTNCTISVDGSYNGKWETISVPIPSTYTCSDTLTTGCWVRLQFKYGSTSKAMDTFSVTASIAGDPVRLVQ